MTSTLPFRPALCLVLATLAAAFAPQALAAPQGLRLAAMSTVYAAGDTVGTVQPGQDCGDSASRAWSDPLQRRVNIELQRAFEAETRRVGAADVLAVSARMDELKLQMCDLGGGAWQGGFEVRMSWQLKRRQGTGPALQANTAGRFEHRPGSTTICPADALREALADAVRQLLADPAVAAALRPPAGADRQLAAAAGG